MKKLEDVTIEETWELFLQYNPPPADMTREDLEMPRNIYMSGFGAMLALARRLETETPERRAKVLDILQAQLLEPITLMATGSLN